MMIEFGHLHLQRGRARIPCGLAFPVLSLALTLAIAQQPTEAVSPLQPAEISKDSPPPVPPEGKKASTSSGPLLQAHPSPAAAANAQRAVRQGDDPIAPRRTDPDSTAPRAADRSQQSAPPPSAPTPAP